MINASSENDHEDNRVGDWQIEQLISLLESSTLSPEKSKELRTEIESFQMFPDRYEELKTMLYQNQVCPIQAGFNYNMTDINRKLRNEIL